jgi:hypothetical protein
MAIDQPHLFHELLVGEVRILLSSTRIMERKKGEATLTVELA